MNVYIYYIILYYIHLGEKARNWNILGLVNCYFVYPDGMGS